MRKPRLVRFLRSALCRLLSWCRALSGHWSTGADSNDEADTIEPRQGFACRIRFRLPEHFHFHGSSRSVRIGKTRDGKELQLKAAEGESLGETQELAVHVMPFPTEEAAVEAGKEYEPAVKRALLKMAFGADFERRSFPSVITDEGMDYLRNQHGPSVRRESMGATAYRIGSAPRWIRFTARASYGTPPERFGALIRSGVEAGPLLPVQEVAFELYSAARFAKSGDVRFLLLFMAFEAMSHQQDRTPEAIAHVERLIMDTNGNEALKEDERRSMVGALRWLKKDSIRQAGIRSCDALGEITFEGWDGGAAELYNRCYEVRNGLTHPGVDLPAASDVRAVIRPLDELVRTLFANLGT